MGSNRWIAWGVAGGSTHVLPHLGMRVRGQVTDDLSSASLANVPYGADMKATDLVSSYPVH